MARSWDETQTSSQEEEDLEQEGYHSSASKRGRIRRVCDWSSLEEDLEEPPYEEADEEEED